MDTSEVTLSDKERAYVRLLGQHMNQYKALLLDIAGPVQSAPDGSQLASVNLSRELALANTRMEEAFMHAREHVFKRASARNAVN